VFAKAPVRLLGVGLDGFSESFHTHGGDSEYGVQALCDLSALAVSISY
jgi:hypothetical protein